MTSIVPLGQIYSAVVQVAPNMEPFFQLAMTIWNTALERENTEKALEAWQAINSILGRLSKTKRELVEEKSGLCLMRFANADKFSQVLRNALAIRKELQATTAKRDQKIAEESFQQKMAGKALGQLAAEAAFGNHEAWSAMIEIAEGKSQMAGPAWTIFNLWFDLQKMAQAKDRLEFAQIAYRVTQSEYQHVLDTILKGKSQKEIGKEIDDFVNGIDPMIQVVDELKERIIPNWRDNPKASDLLHFEVDRILHLFVITANNMKRKEGPTDPSLFRGLTAPMGHWNQLRRIVHLAYIQNLLGAIEGIDIQIDVPERLFLKLDEKEVDNLEVVLKELISNAIKYSDRKKPKRWIRIRWDAEEKTINVKDNGIGIKKPKAVWKRGHREHRESDVGGTGMGLKGVRDRLATIGWKIRLHSKVGAGTTFILIPSEGAFSYE